MSDYSHDQYEMQEALSRLEEQVERPADPEYLSVHSVEDAVRVLAEHGREARLLAGGLDLVGLMKNRIVLPRVLVNINPLTG
jgi:carbon-monoxide dehydrogenase medium subunit